MIELKNINQIYHQKNRSHQVLKDINLHIASGEIFGVLGRSGAGKSTLLRCINLLEKPTTGQVFVNHAALMMLPKEKLRLERTKIGMIFQHFNLLESRSAFGNIAFPLELIGCNKKTIQDKVSTLLALVGLKDKKDYFPSQLSGGQRQRVAIARALATDPHVLLSDEATSALDPESTESILNLLRKINREFGLTILLITHELTVAKQICNRIGILEEGRLIEEGATIDLLTNPKTSVLKNYIQQALHIHYPNQQQEQINFDKINNNSVVVKLTFIGKESDLPLISTLIQQFGITVNIKQAQIEKVQNTTIGFTICEFTGERSALHDALRFVQTTTVKIEVLS